MLSQGRPCAAGTRSLVDAKSCCNCQAGIPVSLVEVESYRKAGYDGSFLLKLLTSVSRILLSGHEWCIVAPTTVSSLEQLVQERKRREQAKAGQSARKRFDTYQERVQDGKQSWTNGILRMHDELYPHVHYSRLDFASFGGGSVVALGSTYGTEVHQH
uniref:Uncharacterized protein n=1 Tax=Physcomitrium patens TaxID=3218 RepID=A0A7I4DL33_PHYPA